MKRQITLLSIGLSLILMGCGSDSGNNTSSNGEPKSTITVPTEISMEIPKALVTEKKLEKIKKQEVENTSFDTSSTPVPIEVDSSMSRGYLELKSDIEQVEDTKKELAINLLLADKVMPKIEESCQDIPLGTTCTIEFGKLSFVLDQDMLHDIEEITNEEIPTEVSSEIENREIQLGKTSFTQYSSTEDYQYALVMDMTPVENNFDSEVMESTQTLKWSKDENHIWSMYSIKDSDMESNMALRYVKKENGQVEVEINDKFEETLSTVEDNEIMKGEFNLKITNLNDDYKITSSSIDYEQGKKMGSSSSVGEISDSKGGYLSFKGVFDGNEYREKEQFNANAEVIFSKYCDSDQECDLNDESTWIEQGNDDVELPFESDFVSLTVSGGNLKEGQFLLLAPNSTIENLSFDEIFEASIGEIYVVEEGIYGMLYSKDYLSQLNELVLVYVNMPFDENEPLGEPTFELVGDDKYPTLKEE